MCSFVAYVTVRTWIWQICWAVMSDDMHTSSVVIPTTKAVKTAIILLQLCLHEFRWKQLCHLKRELTTVAADETTDFGLTIASTVFRATRHTAPAKVDQKPKRIISSESFHDVEGEYEDINCDVCEEGEGGDQDDENFKPRRKNPIAFNVACAIKEKVPLEYSSILRNI